MNNKKAKELVRKFEEYYLKKEQEQKKIYCIMFILLNVMLCTVVLLCEPKKEGEKMGYKSRAGFATGAMECSPRCKCLLCKREKIENKNKSKEGGLQNGNKKNKK